MDMVGNVWQWTDEFVDEHTRAGILRGGSHYQPQGSRWYFPQAYLLSEHGKYLLMAPSLDRSGAVGFRCVKDAKLPEECRSEFHDNLEGWLAIWQQPGAPLHSFSQCSAGARWRFSFP